ncbi:MAG TPA: hypothetical protein VN896_07520 [Methylomirabilota bacterium]|jgi:hypothetical protein|nr:hypothetical protein [Methylomirabilota bacterium]
MRFLRASMAVALLVALLIQSLVALAAPRAARADVPPRYVAPAPQQELPQDGKDPRRC